MNSTQVLSIYEHIAGLTNQMVSAARASDWESLNHLEKQCADQAQRLESDSAPALIDAARQRKVDLLKQILANDRQIRAITEPQMARVDKVMRGAVAPCKSTAEETTV